MRQDDNHPVGSFGTLAGIKLLSHFRKNSSKRPSLVPRERFLEFLRLNVADDDAVVDYMESYEIYPTGYYEKNIKKSLVDDFRTEHLLIKAIALRATNGTLDDADLQLINSKLSGINTRLKAISEPELLRINENLNNADVGEGFINKLHGAQHVVATQKYSHSFLTIYEDLYYLCLGKAKLRACKFCGNFFSPTRRNQIYCDAVHKEASRELRRTPRKKIKK